MRPFRLKKTITQATVLSALLPSAAVLSQPVHAPMGLSGKITISAGTTAVLGHQIIPEGVAPMDPKSAPARGGYVYDNFNTVVRTGVTGECVKHGLWSPEIATPDCEPWLFATPPAPKAAAPAPSPSPAPAPQAKAETPSPPPPVVKEEGFPEWPGPDEGRLGIVPLWPENNLEAQDNIGLPRMHFDDEVADSEHAADLIGAPILHGDNEDGSAEAADLIAPPVVYYQNGDGEVGASDLISPPVVHYQNEEGEAGADDLISPPVVYYQNGDGEAGADDLISAPRSYEDGDVLGQPLDGRWPEDPYAAADAVEEEPAVASRDDWMSAPLDDKADAPVAGIMEFKEEETWPVDKFADGHLEDQSVVQPDSNWMIPNPVPEAPADAMVGHYQEDGKEPEEIIGNPTVFYDVPDQGVIPEETIIGHTMLPGEDQEDSSVGNDDLITSHSIYHDDDNGAQAAGDDLIGQPRQNTMDDQPAEAAEPYGSQFDDKPFPEVAVADEPEGQPFSSEFPVGSGTAASAPAEGSVAPAPVAPEEVAEDEEEGEEGDYHPDYSSTLAAKDAFAVLPQGKTAPSPVPSAPAEASYGLDVEEEEEPEVPFVPDYSNVATAKGALDNLPYPAAAAQPAASAPEKAIPAAKAATTEEHLMTVVLSADALFDFDRYVLKGSAKKSLDDFVAALKDIKWGEIQVVGHTDRLGSAKYNQRLSERRAQAVRKLLISKGVDGKKIKAIGKGKVQPVTTDCVGEKRSKELIVCLQPDRRVEIFVDEKREVQVTKPTNPK